MTFGNNTQSIQKGYTMNRIICSIAAIVTITAALSAQQINIFGKVCDSTGAPQQDVIVSLAAHPEIVDMTGADGLFALTGQATSRIRSKSTSVKSFISCNGNMVCIGLNEPAIVSIEVFTSLGQQISKLQYGAMAAGSYRIPTATLPRQPQSRNGAHCITGIR
jgi:hypothetical protein